MQSQSQENVEATKKCVFLINLSLKTKDSFESSHNEFDLDERSAF